ncbi:MAG: hypothetical protein ACRDNP_13440, partial [Gaiellaceae bacterium]
MDQSSWDDTLVDVGPSRPSPGDAVSHQSSRDKRQKRSPGKTSRGEGRAISGRVGERTREGIGVSVPRIDGVPKVKGQFAYGSDLWVDEMLWGHTLRSPHPHARIRSIEIGEAVASPGVYAVLLADDVPGTRFYGLEFADQPVLAWEVVRYVGEPVALVAAEHPELARRAAEKIVVDYEPLPAVTDMIRALEPGAPSV